MTGWLWSFGDGGSSTEPNPVYQYNAAGNYTVGLVAYGPDGQDRAVVENAVHVLGPVGAISVTSNLGEASFRITGPGGTVLTGAGMSSGYVDRPAGSYTITWNPQTGYVAPPSQTFELTDGGSVAFDGTYAQLPGPDTTPPTVLSAVPANGSGNAEVQAIRLRISEQVRVTSGALIVQNQDGVVFSPAEVAIESESDGTIELVAGFTVALPDGYYSARLRDTVLDMQDNALDGDANGTEGGDFVLRFSVRPVRGDLNCDGEVNFDDINPFVTALVSREGYESRYPGCAWLNADCNDDGSVDFDDINPFVKCLVHSGCP